MSKHTWCINAPIDSFDTLTSQNVFRIIQNCIQIYHMPKWMTRINLISFQLLSICMSICVVIFSCCPDLTENFGRTIITRTCVWLCQRFMVLLYRMYCIQWDIIVWKYAYLSIAAVTKWSLNKDNLRWLSGSSFLPSVRCPLMWMRNFLFYFHFGSGIIIRAHCEGILPPFGLLWLTIVYSPQVISRSLIWRGFLYQRGPVIFWDWNKIERRNDQSWRGSFLPERKEAEIHTCATCVFKLSVMYHECGVM